ncbi:zinc finger protein 271 isoform X1 [Drosophila grimshawi]|uniref:GH17975 n=1 Tax=Drosophila grimshawi TaxID=7222 RepID=B4JSK1_DROGR|nr:zinc finger protein 271 isoform X1 [Drosophila grimshawi]EDV94741.1 GH17975 [Drosophila grimshawi]
MHLNHATAATAAMANYQHYAPSQLATHGGGGGSGSGIGPNGLQQPTTIASLQQGPFALHQLTAVQAIQHPTHQAMLHPQHPLVHLLDISTTTTNSGGGNHTPISPMKQEVQSVISEDESVVDDPRKKKQCHVCKNKFRQLTTLRNHMKIHTDERPYKCKHCDKAFRQISTLTNHVKIHTGEKPFTCNICAKDFRQQSTLINHIKTHKAAESSTPTSLLNYQPPSSSGKHSRKSQSNQMHNAYQQQHQQQQQRVQISKTLYSGTYSSPQAEELVKPYQCSVCKRRFPQLSTLHNHERTHIDPKPYKCETCDKSFSQLATLANHKKIHTGDKPYTCSYCHMQFRQQSTLTNHMKTHTHLASSQQQQQQNPTTVTATVDHSTMPAPLAPGTHQLTSGLLPNNLHSTTPNILQLDHHPLLHFLDGSTTVSSVVASNVAAAAAAGVNTKVEHYQAVQSGRMSVGNINMLKGDNPDRPFGCSVCRRFFSQQSTLVNHIKTHTGEKPYKCKICEVSFRQVATLNNHMKIHTGEKPYNCSYCPKQFRQKSTLQNHLRVHTC